MNNKKDIHQIIENFIQEERNAESNPFLSTRIIAAVEKKATNEIILISPFWKATMVALSFVVAVFTGIATDSLYKPTNNANDVVLINDSRMENFEFYILIGNE